MISPLISALMLFSLANHFINSLSSFKVDCMTIFVVVKYSFIIFISTLIQTLPTALSQAGGKGSPLLFQLLTQGLEEVGSNVQRLR